MAKASDNLFPKLLLAEGVAPANPAAGSHAVFVDETDGKLKRIDSAGVVNPIEGSAGGGGSSLTPTPDDPPASPSAFDYEFADTRSTLPTGWSWVNQGASTYSEAAGVGSVMVAAGASDEWRGVVRSIPATTSFIASAKSTMLTKQASNTFPSRGLALRDSSTGKLAVLHTVWSPADQAPVSVALDYYSSPTAFGSRVGTVNVAGDWGLPYLRLRKNSATSWDFFVSADGGAWLPLYTGVNVSTFLTPDQIGLAVNQRTNAPALGLHWFRAS